MVMKSCSNCGFTRNTNPSADLCAKCENHRRYEYFKQEWLCKLQQTHTVIKYAIDKGIHSKVEVQNRDCGHTFIAKLNNILNGFTKCGVCGPKLRTKNASIAYEEKHGRTYDITVWNEYKRVVWLLTNNFYKENKHKLNPMGLPRKKAGSHKDAVNLDHIVPMIYCFKNGLPVELAADPMNIQIISAVENLNKKQKLTEEANDLLKILKIKHNL